MIRASPLIVFFSVVLASIYPVSCTWAGGGSTLSQSHHSPAKRHIYRGYECADCNKEIINPVLTCALNHILCEHCVSRRKRHRRYSCSECGKALLAKIVPHTAKNARYLEPLNKRQSKPSHRASQRRSRQPYHPDIHTLSTRANQLSKNKRDMDQLAELAQSLLGSRELRQATAIDLALLVNSVSKLIPLRIHKRTAKKCISQFSQEIVRRDLREWGEQSLTMIANGLSKVEGKETTEALKEVAKLVRQVKKAWKEQHLAMLANALSKVDGREITEALKVIAQKVNQVGVRGWKEQHLAMLASGLSKVEGKGITEALKNIAQEVNRVGVRKWTEQHLTMLANGLSKAESDVITEALKEIAQEVNRRGVQGWTEQQMAIMADGLSKVEGKEISEALKKIAKVVRRGQNVWTELDLAVLASGLSKVEGKEITEALKEIAQEVNRVGVKEWTEQHLAMLANGLSKADGREITDTLKKIAKVVLRGRKVWTEQQLAMLANGLSKAEGIEFTDALKKIAQEVNRVGVKGWTERQLAMLTTGLRKAEGREITKAFKKIAEVVRGGQKVWTEQQLAILASGFSKVEGEEVTEALKKIAKEVRRGQKVWTEKQLAILASGLSKVDGEEITRALKKIAQEASRIGVEGWIELDLVMLANGVSKVEGKEITGVLKEIAQEINRVGVKGWAEKHLAVLTTGLRKEESKEITEALKVVAQEVIQRDVKKWTEQDLAMMINGFGAIADHPAFSTCVNELISRQSSKWLLIELGNLCRLQLSEYQAQAALDIVVALDKQGFEPEDQHQGKDIVWCLTLLHFVFGNQEDEVSCQACQQLRGLYEKFTGYLGDYPASSGDFNPKLIDDLWQEYYARDYWKKDKPLPAPSVTYMVNAPSISWTQKVISGAIEKEIPSAKIREEVCINGFPVDMLIGEKVCVEIDGPYHYIYSDQPGLYNSAARKENPVAEPQVQKHLRAKDHFIVYMLEKYGYSVFRIPYDMRMGSRQFQHVIQDVQEALNRAD